MPAKKPKKIIKLQISGGAANPAPPVGPALGQHGLNIQEFCQKFNAATINRKGEIVPVIVNVYADRTYDFILKTAPASDLLKKAAGIQKGSPSGLKQIVGKVKLSDLRLIAEKKMPDLNTTDLDAASRIIEGTAKQMGLEVVEG